nr:hypothetical protein [Tanacetum cinerariifolium]
MTNGNPSRVNIKQLCGRGTNTLSGNPVTEVLLKLILPGHGYSIHTVKWSSRNQRIRQWRYNLTPAELKFKTPHARSSR